MAIKVLQSIFIIKVRIISVNIIKIDIEVSFKARNRVLLKVWKKNWFLYKKLLLTVAFKANLSFIFLSLKFLFK